jgi:hypothetical protein
MAHSHIRLISKVFAPAAVGTSETTALFSMRAGQRVHWATVVPLRAAAASTSSTITIGDAAGGVDGYVIATTDYDPEASAVGTLIQGTGTLFAQSGGKLYTADDTVDAVYTANAATGAIPKIRVILAISDDLD